MELLEISELLADADAAGAKGIRFFATWSDGTPSRKDRSGVS
jgi:hypothetical protein